jgi:hypothetical protein
MPLGLANGGHQATKVYDTDSSSVRLRMTFERRIEPDAQGVATSVMKGDMVK